MGKKSSSVKKKRSKKSSQARIKKRSKSRTRRSYKLKKLLRHDDSASYSSDSDDSRSSVSISSSSFDDDCTRKRSRSRTRKDVKVSKKSARRRSSSSASTEDSSHVKKQKRTKKNDDFWVSKKSCEKKNKKSKRDVSISSASSGSRSCSTCQGGSSNSDEREVKKNRGRSVRKNIDRRRSEKVKTESKRRGSRTRSRSCSSCSRYSDYRSEEKLTGEANSRRLRSVIAIVRDGKEGNTMDNEHHKEEMVYDRDDYPSSRSNDSNDGGNMREFIYTSHAASEEKKHAKDERGEAVVSNIRTCKVEGSDKDSEGHETNDDVKAKKTGDSGAVDSTSRYDLESKLRQKALENLRMFRRGHQTDPKIPFTRKDVIGSEVNTPSSTKSELSENRYLKGASDRVISARQVAERSNNSADISQNDEKVSSRNDNNKESGSAKDDVEHPPGRLALAANPNERVGVIVSSESNKPQLVALASGQESSSSCTIKKVEPALQQPPQAKFMAGNRVDATQTANSLSGNSNHGHANNVSASDDPSSLIKSPSGATNSNKQQHEANDSSQFQQKTMSVMRGGEMVEVSYKVYIPKKATALARRSLNR